MTVEIQEIWSAVQETAGCDGAGVVICKIEVLLTMDTENRGIPSFTVLRTQLQPPPEVDK